MFRVVLMVLCLGVINGVIAQEKVTLYPTGLINHKNGAELGDNVPELYFFKPEKQLSSTAFLIIPGGGYSRVAIQHEGFDVAEKLKKLGCAAFVLRYRLPNQEQQEEKETVAIQDAQTALSLVRNQAQKLGLDHIDRIGVIGFSAGGHLASTLSTHHRTDYRTGEGALENLRPDFSVLVYPVISMDDQITHMGSKTKLIGPDFKEKDVALFSNDLNVDQWTPPTFLVHAEDDKGVPIANSERYLEQLHTVHVPATLFRYKTGGHGFGLVNKTDDRSWFDAMMQWLDTLVIDSNVDFKASLEWRSKIGEKVPTFSVENKAGDTVSIESFGGTVVLINLFATWCPACREELPFLQRELWDKLKDRPDFYTMVFAREEGWDKLDPFMEANNYNFPVFPDLGRKVYRLFAAQTIPRNIVISKEGKIVYQSIGFDKEEFATLLKVINEELEK